MMAAACSTPCGRSREIEVPPSGQQQGAIHAVGESPGMPMSCHTHQPTRRATALGQHKTIFGYFDGFDAGRSSQPNAHCPVCSPRSDLDTGQAYAAETAVARHPQGIPQTSATPVQPLCRGHRTERNRLHWDSCTELSCQSTRGILETALVRGSSCYQPSSTRRIETGQMLNSRSGRHLGFHKYTYTSSQLCALALLGPLYAQRSSVRKFVPQGSRRFSCLALRPPCGHPGYSATSGIGKSRVRPVGLGGNLILTRKVQQ